MITTASETPFYSFHPCRDESSAFVIPITTAIVFPFIVIVSSVITFVFTIGIVVITATVLVVAEPWLLCDRACVSSV